jgi:alkylated DNA repair protein (DNA oxidative demethylase)
MTRPEAMFPMDLFEDGRRAMPLQPGALLLGGFAAGEAPDLLAELYRVEAAAPFRRMLTPDGWPMSVAMTNCGSIGWVTDRTGYRYDPLDPETGQAWPAMPDTFRRLAVTLRRHRMMDQCRSRHGVRSSRRSRDP